jgi:hypothetical protein
MSRRTGRFTVLALTIAAFAAMSVAAAPAGAFIFKKNFVNWTVTGSITAKKLNQTINFPAGATFNGEGEANVEGLQKITGTVTNATVFVPPFSATISILGIPTTVGTSFTQVGKSSGTLASVATSNCGGAEGCVEVSVPAEANIGITSVGILGIKLPTSCTTSKPVSLPLKDDLTVFELFETGTSFHGTATIPSIKCGGLGGILIAPVLTSLFSGPDNAYTFSFAPPAA